MSLDLYSNEITSSEAFPHNVKQILPNVQSFCEDELEGLSSGDEEEDDQVRIRIIIHNAEIG